MLKVIKEIMMLPLEAREPDIIARILVEQANKKVTSFDSRRPLVDYLKRYKLDPKTISTDGATCAVILVS